MSRPRTVSLEPDEMIILGEEMVAWVKQNKPMHLKQWYSIEKQFTRSEWDTFKRRDEFIIYYEQALSVISIGYLDGTIAPAIAQRFLRYYFHDLRQQEDQDAQDKIDRELALKLKIIECESKSGNLVPPRDQIVTLENESMTLRHELQKAQDKITALEASQNDKI